MNPRHNTEVIKAYEYTIAKLEKIWNLLDETRGELASIPNCVPGGILLKYNGTDEPHNSILYAKQVTANLIREYEKALKSEKENAEAFG